MRGPIALAELKSSGHHRAGRTVGAMVLLAALLLGGCGAAGPETDRAMYRERADLMYMMNRPNVTGENPGTEVTDSIWWFY